MQPGMYRVNEDGVAIHISEWRGAEPPLLAVHGLTANGRSFDTMARELDGARRLLAMDLRGRGLSDKPDIGYSLTAHVADMAVLLKELGINRVALMGHSLGAYICLAFAYTHPEMVERIILIDAGAQLTQAQWGEVTEGIKPSVDLLERKFSSMDEFLSAVKKSPFVKPWIKAHEDYYRHAAREKDGMVRTQARPGNIAEERGNLLKTDTSVYYQGVSCPVLILRAQRGMLGEGGLVLPEEATRELLKALPRAEVVDLDRDHFSILFAPDEERAEAVRRFLNA